MPFIKKNPEKGKV